MAVAHLVKWSFPKPEVRTWNPVKWQFLFTVKCIGKMEIKKKMLAMFHLKFCILITLFCIKMVNIRLHRQMQWQVLWFGHQTLRTAKASFSFFRVFQTVLKNNNCRLQRNSNSDHLCRRQARLPRRMQQQHR